MKFLTIFFPLFFPIGLLAFNLNSLNTRPTHEAHRIIDQIKVDGILSEEAWHRPGIIEFTQREPIEGAKPSQRSEVWIGYDDEAIYIAARLYDDHSDSIVSRIGRRDAELNSDWFAIAFDSYHDRRTGFFSVLIRAVQFWMEFCITIHGMINLGMVYGMQQPQ